MANVTTATGTLAVEVREHYNKTLLYMAKPQLVHTKHAKQHRIPRGEGKVMNWRRFSTLAPATVALTEGVTPAGSEPVATGINVTVSQYGDFIRFSDRVSVQSIDPIMQEQAELLGQQAGNTFDIIARDAWLAGTNVRYTAGRASRATLTAADVILDADIKKLRRELKRNMAPTINGDYIAIVHPNTYLDLQGTDAFKNTGYYSDPQKIYNGEVIKLYGIVFIESTNATYIPAGTNGAPVGVDVYQTICFGQHALGVVDIESLGLQTIYKPLGSEGSGDPLNQRASQGWKGTFAAKILNQSFLVRLEHAVTA